MEYEKKRSKEEYLLQVLDNVTNELQCRGISGNKGYCYLAGALNTYFGNKPPVDQNAGLKN
ncbi:MAG: hypothetical protein QXM68_01660 [Candidatus Aenigmatarchaeota archaeon]|nr:hypothetical protein [Candidatus Aenigmarchaeota archaeon]